MRRSFHQALHHLLFTIIAAGALLLLPFTRAYAQQPAEAPAANGQETPLAARMDALLSKLDAARIEHHVPGLGLAVIKNGEVVLCTGLGQATIENNTKADGDTVFAIGSCTKAFTAALIAALADDGTMAWDDKVSEHLPEFRMRDQTANEQVTIRDLLCHRTGLGRMDLLWAAGTLSRAEILAAVERAEPMHEFREKFEYSNTNFIAAGEAAARAAGASWEDLMRDRLLEPLHMSNSTLTLAEAKLNPKLATGYQWNDESQQFEIDPMRDIASAAPAGSINASARDMANWVLMQLNRGDFNGSRVISEENIIQTWEKHTSVSPTISYGLGWMVGEWRGRRLIEHGGNIDGFAATVGFLPDENAGYVLLMNVSFTPLQFLGRGIIFDTMLGEEGQAPADERQQRDYTPYLGKYIADFGPFKNAAFTVQVKNEHLAVDVPGQMIYELKEPDDEGKWYFQITDDVAVTFGSDDAGSVVVMNMHQGGLTFELPREGAEPAADVTLEEARDYLGKYHFEPAGADAEVLVHNGRLAIDIPGQMIYDLRGPDDEGVWTFRATDSITLSFNRNDTGGVESITMLQQGVEFLLPRTGDADPDEVITLEEVIALHRRAMGGDNLDDIETIRMIGTINFVNQGLEGALDVVAEGMSHYRNHIDLGRSGTIDVIVAGDHGWSASSFEATETLSGKYLKSAQRQHPLLMAADWRDFADTVELLEAKTINDRPHYIVRVKLDDMIDSEVAIDAGTGLVTGENITVAVRNLGALPMTLRYDDYRQVAGLMMPSRFTLETGFHGKAVMEFQTIEVNIDLPEDAFAPPADAAAAATAPAE